MNTKCTYFDGNTITVSEGSLRSEDLIGSILYTLEDYYGDHTLHDETREYLSRMSDDGEEFGITELLYDLGEELEALAEMHGYEFTTLEGDGAHFVLRPVSHG